MSTDLMPLRDRIEALIVEAIAANKRWVHVGDLARVVRERPPASAEHHAAVQENYDRACEYVTEDR